MQISHWVGLYQAEVFEVMAQQFKIPLLRLDKKTIRVQQSDSLNYIWRASCFGTNVMAGAWAFQANDQRYRVVLREVKYPSIPFFGVSKYALTIIQ